MTDLRTDKQKNYIFALLKEADVWETRIEDLERHLPDHIVKQSGLAYYTEREPEMKTWEWLDVIDMDQAKKLIVFLQRETGQ